jgi:hypothetical protein
MRLPYQWYRRVRYRMASFPTREVVVAIYLEGEEERGAGAGY